MGHARCRRWSLFAHFASIAACTWLLATSARADAVAVGAASGKLTFDGKTVQLTHAYAFPVENLFDDKKKDTMVVLTDRALPADQSADDDVGLSLIARKGELAALRLRIADGKAAGAAIFREGISGMLLFPGKSMTFTSAPKVLPSAIAGDFKTEAPLEMDGHTWTADAKFSAKIVAFAPPATEAPPISAPPPEPIPPPLPKRDPQQSATETRAIIMRIMQHDSAGAVKFIQGGMDPNGRDENGLSVLNWAVMSCDVPVVKALVDKGADVNYQRMPGYTMLMEAGACPAAEKLLRAAGAK